MNELRLPWPPSALGPNARLHWRKKAPITKAYKKTCWAIAKEAGWGPILVKVGTRLHLFVTFYPPDKRHRDDDNVFSSFKAGRDGLALALDINDRLFISHPFLHTETGGYVKVRITTGD